MIVPEDIRDYFVRFEDQADNMLSSECIPEDTGENTIIKWYYGSIRAESEMHALNWLRSKGCGPMTYGMHHKMYNHWSGQCLFHGVEVEKVLVLNPYSVPDWVRGRIYDMEYAISRELNCKMLVDVHPGQFGMDIDHNLLIIDGGVVVHNASNYEKAKWYQDIMVY